MRVICRHGHFAFYPRNEIDISRFANYFGLDLVHDQDFYTFTLLKDAPNYSLQLAPWLNLPAIKTYAGQYPWDVMRENNFVYSLSLSAVVPVTSILSVANLSRSNYYYISQSALVQPGSYLNGQQILSYDAEFNLEVKQLKIRSFSFE